MIIRVPDEDVTWDLPEFFKSCAYCEFCTEYCGSPRGYYFVECQLDKDVIKGCQGKCNDFVKERS